MWKIYFHSLLAKGSTNQTELQKNKLLDFEIPYITDLEQQEIADYLDLQSEKINAIVSNINTQIQKLQTLRKSLINEIVTGERSIV